MSTMSALNVDQALNIDGAKTTRRVKAKTRRGAKARGVSCTVRQCEASITPSEFVPSKVPTIASIAEEDKALLLLVVFFERAGAIDWDGVLTHMSPTTRTAQDLQDRLEFLTSSDTAILNQLPSTYIAGSCLERLSTMNLSRKRPHEEMYIAINEILCNITYRDVRQPSGKRHLNAGELASGGVTTILDALKLTSNDVFADIGSGTGSVLAQVLLESPVVKAFGIEIRPGLAQKSRDAMQRSADKYPKLNGVKVLNGDIRYLSSDMRSLLLISTVIYCNNIAFRAEDNLGLHEFICSFAGDLHTVLLTQRFCSRCSPLCGDMFCTSWIEKREIQAETCWKQEPVRIFMYVRKETVKPCLMNIINQL